MDDLDNPSKSRDEIAVYDSSKRRNLLEARSKRHSISAVERFKNEVEDSIELLAFAIATGCNVADNIIERIEATESLLNDGSLPNDSQRIDFEKAYRDLAKFMHPVTVETLRASTDGSPFSPSRGFISRHLFPRSSDAKVYSKQLWSWMVFSALVIVLTQTVGDIYAADEETAGSGLSGFILFAKPLIPFFYGLLGALIYLLRTAHSYIAECSFDLRRVPEYYNRMLLGFVSGGIVLLFVDPKSFSIREGAISFIVGYNTDYLFDTLERIASSIFPKTNNANAAEKTNSHRDFGSELKVASITADKTDSGIVGTVVLTHKVESEDAKVVIESDQAWCHLRASTIEIPRGQQQANFSGTLDAGVSGTVVLTASLGRSKERVKVIA